MISSDRPDVLLVENLSLVDKLHIWLERLLYACWPILFFFDLESDLKMSN